MEETFVVKNAKKKKPHTRQIVVTRKCLIRAEVGLNLGSISNFV